MPINNATAVKGYSCDCTYLFSFVYYLVDVLLHNREQTRVENSLLLWVQDFEHVKQTVLFDHVCVSIDRRRDLEPSILVAAVVGLARERRHIQHG